MWNYRPSSIVYRPGEDGPMLNQDEGDEGFRVLAVTTVQPQQIALNIAARLSEVFAVFISRAAVTNLMRHGAKGWQTNREVAGGLVGQPGYDPGSRLWFTRIRAALPVPGQGS